MAGRYSIEFIFKAVDMVTASVKKMTRGVNRALLGVKGEAYKMNEIFDFFGPKLSSLFQYATIGAAGLTAALVGVTMAFSKVENAEASFRPMLGGLEAAKKLVGQLNVLAAETPFGFEELSKSASNLISMSAATPDDVIAKLKIVGDLSRGSVDALGSITKAYGQVAAKGKASTQEFYQFTEAGVPLMQQLEKQWKVNSTRVFAMIERGRLTRAEVEKALMGIVGPNGKLYNGMFYMSETTTGMWAEFTDNATLAAAAVGEAISPVVKDFINILNRGVKLLRQFTEANKKYIGDEAMKYWTDFKNNIGTTVDKLLNIIKIAAYFAAFVIVIKTLIGVFTLLNLVMAMNPIVLVIGAIVGLLALLTIYSDEILAWFDGLSLKARILFGPFNALLLVVEGIVRAIAFVKDNWGAIGKFTGMWGEGDGVAGPGTPAPVSWQENLTRFVNENTNTSEVVIKDETGRAVPTGKLPPGIKVQATGTW